MARAATVVKDAVDRRVGCDVVAPITLTADLCMRNAGAIRPSQEQLGKQKDSFCQAPPILQPPKNMAKKVRPPNAPYAIPVPLADDVVAAGARDVATRTVGDVVEEPLQGFHKPLVAMQRLVRFGIR